jgi:hypothetical protein
MTAAEIRDRESRWAVPAALAAFAAAVLIIASIPLNSVSGTGAAEVLRSTDAHSGSVAAVAVLQGFAFLLLIVPLVHLFRAIRVRSETVRTQLIGLVVVAPLFLAVSTGLSVARGQEAADQFTAGEAKSTLSRTEAKKDCESDREDEGAEDFADEYEPERGESANTACERRKVEDDEASNAVSEAALTPLVTGLGLAGAIGLIVVLFYCGLWGMRTGLLSRFWGSLGMALSVAILLGLLPLVTVWFLYLGLLYLGWLPGGKPPAWEAGKAVPWPTPGERAAAELEPSDGGADTAEDEAARREREQRG